MPKSNRWTIKQKLDGTIGKMEKSRDELIELAAQYKDGYPEYYNALMFTADAQNKVIPLANNIRDAI